MLCKHLPSDVEGNDTADVGLEGQQGHVQEKAAYIPAYMSVSSTGTMQEDFGIAILHEGRQRLVQMLDWTLQTGRPAHSGL